MAFGHHLNIPKAAAAGGGASRRATRAAGADPAGLSCAATGGTCGQRAVFFFFFVFSHLSCFLCVWVLFLVLGGGGTQQGDPQKGMYSSGTWSFVPDVMKTSAQQRNQIALFPHGYVLVNMINWKSNNGVPLSAVCLTARMGLKHRMSAPGLSPFMSRDVLWVDQVMRVQKEKQSEQRALEPRGFEFLSTQRGWSISRDLQGSQVFSNNQVYRRSAA